MLHPKITQPYAPYTYGRKWHGKVGWQGVWAAIGLSCTQRHPRATSDFQQIWVGESFWLADVPGNYPLGAWGEGGEVNASVNHTLVAFWPKDKALVKFKSRPEAFWCHLKTISPQFRLPRVLLQSATTISSRKVSFEGKPPKKKMVELRPHMKLKTHKLS